MISGFWRTSHLALCVLAAMAIALLPASVWAGETGEGTASAPGKKPLVILIGIDGFKPDYLLRGNSPTLDGMIETGAFARGLVPSFPSVTFPNHYTLVTGKVPDHHGIVNNVMVDPTILGPTFALAERLVISNPQWWNEAAPIWVTLERHHKRASTLFWPGSEVKIQGVTPSDWRHYEHGMSSEKRADALVNWLDSPDAERADFATLYFSEVDAAGHRFGPDSPEVADAVRRVDRAIGRLVAGLARLDLAAVTDLVVVSDHGMAKLLPGQVIDLKSLLAPFPSARVQWTGPLSGFVIAEAERGAALAALGRQEHLTCWPKAEMPARFRFGTHRRIPDIVCLSDVGWTTTPDPAKGLLPGDHGFDPEAPDMWALFLASGPRIRPGRLGLVRNVEVYPLLCRLAGVPEEPSDADGSLAEQVIAPAKR